MPVVSLSVRRFLSGQLRSSADVPCSCRISCSGSVCRCRRIYCQKRKRHRGRVLLGRSRESSICGEGIVGVTVAVRGGFVSR
jgi:hypothetical protein